MSIVVVDTLEELLDRDDLRIKGQIVFVNDINEIRYFNGFVWESFSKIYIQDTPPVLPILISLYVLGSLIHNV